MRRTASLAVAAALTLGGVAAAASQDATLSVSPNKAGKGTTATLDVHPPKKGQDVSGLTVRAARGAKFDPRAVKVKCTAQQASSNSCPAKSRIGGGTVQATVSSAAFNSPVQVQVDLYLAPPQHSGDKAGVVAHFKVSQTGQQGHVIGRVRTIASGLYGLETVFSGLDKALKPPAGFKAHTDSIHLSFGKHRTVTRRRNGKKRKVRINLLRNPKTCTGSWPYEVIIAYPSGAPVDVRSSGPCTK